MMNLRRDRKGPICSVPRWPVNCALGALLVTGGCATTRVSHDIKAFGLEYGLQKLTDPRPNRVHTLRVDLGNPSIHPAVVMGADPDGPGPAETELRDPRKLADEPAVLAYINTCPWASFADSSGESNRDWFEGQPVDICGLAVSKGVVRSPAPVHAASVWISADGRVFVGEHPGIETAVDVVTGFQRIVTGGVLAVGSGGDLHPRTAIGVNDEGTVIWLVVVDGRQEGYSEGMTVHELGEIMLGLGCRDAVNMDGGGSSIMGLVDASRQLQVINSPSDRRLGVRKIRPLPMVLTIRKR
ncbi:MAG: phosphodiester glycosidase family protein [Verrucomicrobia bacterium]|nr:phosphodiester glycosidase family protein [Verrucomicrobiota bacterium]MDA1086665.1 phosphodiester glycosidase family protein [Verrucomicrobiota bacterium]